MIEIKYTTRVFPYPEFGSVCVRVRWNKKKNSVDFTTGDFVEFDKWDNATQRAKTNTKHIVRTHERYAWQQLEASWKPHSKYKYLQVVGHLLAANPGIRIDQIDKAALLRLREWYFEQGRHNQTIVKWMGSLLTLLRWARDNGYTVQNEALSFKHRIVVPEKRITYLQYDELMHFHNFVFPAGTAPHIVRARDFFCFMAFTSLRYSDMAALKKADVTAEYIQLYTIKTRDKLQIPILSFAQEIIDRYKDLPGDNLFPAPSNQKLNDYIKDAAKLAGLNRQVVETYFVDKEPHERVNALWETTEIKREIINSLDGAPDAVLKKVLKLLKK